MTSSSKLTDTYEQKLLDGWEDVYKKGQLTFWILFALYDKEKHMSQIKEFVTKATNGTQSADDQSMYRALRRFESAELIGFRKVASKSGPDLKLYSLTRTGKNVLRAFTKRNIVGVYFNSATMSQLKKITN